MFVVLQCVDIASICVVAVCCDSAVVRLWRAGFRCHGCDSLYRYLPCQFPLVCRLLVILALLVQLGYREARVLARF